MQRFLISIIIPALIAWGICSYMVFFTLPQSSQWVVLFLATLFVALELTIGTIIYLIRNRRAPEWLGKRELLRENMILTLLPALSLPTYLLLRYTTLDTWYVIILLNILVILCEYHIIRKLL